MTLDLKALKREVRSKATSPARLLELAALDPQLSREVAKAQHAPASVLERLARSGDLTTRKYVATNPLTPPALLDALATDRQWTVLKAVAENPRTPPRSLEALADHARHTVRLALLDNPGVTQQIVERLNGDLDPAVRTAVLSHDALPTALKRQALTDSLAEVRAAALVGLAHVRLHHGGLSAADLDVASNDPDEHVQYAVAGLLDQDDLIFHSAIPAGHIRRLADDLLKSTDSLVKCAAARRATPDLLPGQLIPLLHEPGYDAARILIERTADPRVTTAILKLNDTWLKHYLAEYTRDATIYDHLLRDAEARDYLPGNPHIPDSFWIRVGRDTLADSSTVKAHLPLVKRALKERHRPALLGWFTRNLPALLRHVPDFAGEIFDWRRFDASDVHSIAYTYLHEPDTRSDAETILAILDQGATP